MVLACIFTRGHCQLFHRLKQHFCDKTQRKIYAIGQIFLLLLARRRIVVIAVLLQTLVEIVDEEIKEAQLAENMGGESRRGQMHTFWENIKY